MSLMHLSEEQVHRIVLRATALNATFPDSEHGMKVGDPDAFREARDYRFSPEARALTEAVRSLSDNARHELTALMWLGREDSGDFSTLVTLARKNANAGDVEYITAKAPSLPRYLACGLAALKAMG